MWQLMRQACTQVSEAVSAIKWEGAWEGIGTSCGTLEGETQPIACNVVLHIMSKNLKFHRCSVNISQYTLQTRLCQNRCVKHVLTVYSLYILWRATCDYLCQVEGICILLVRADLFCVGSHHFFAQFLLCAWSAPFPCWRWWGIPIAHEDLSQT